MEAKDLVLYNEINFPFFLIFRRKEKFRLHLDT
jgi:hypothetical protein